MLAKANNSAISPEETINHLRVLAWPASQNRHSNPYNDLLVSGMEAYGISVTEFSVWAAFRGRYDVWHLHWPEVALNDKTYLIALARAVALLMLVMLSRLRRKAVVWTIHNDGSHEQSHPRLERLFFRCFVRLLTGYILLSAATREGAFAKWPRLKRLRGYVVPLGHFQDVYHTKMAHSEARAKIGISLDTRVVLFVGAVREYKNLPRLVQCFVQMADPDTTLVIAGHARTPELKRALQQLTAPHSNIVLNLSLLSSEDVAMYLQACNLVVLPYTRILNSASVLLALSCARPVLVPNEPTLRELASECGDEWVRTYDGELSDSDLRSALLWSAKTSRATAPDLSARDWPGLRARTAEAYRAIHSGAI